MEAPSPRLEWLRKRELWGAILGVVSLVAALALLSVARGGASQALARTLRRLFGWGAYPVVALSLVASAWLLAREHLARWLSMHPTQLLGLELFLLGCLGLLHAPFTAAEGYELARVGAGGGYVGWALAYTLKQAAGRVGGPLVLAGAAVAGLVLVFDLSWEILVAASDQLLSLTRERFGWPAPELPRPEPPSPAAVEPQPQIAEAPRPSPAIAVPGRPAAPAPRPRRPRTRNPHLPSLDLLTAGSVLPTDDADIRYQAQLIEETLAHFGIPAQVVDVRRGPTVTQYGVEPGFVERRRGDGVTERRKVRVSRIVALANDLALALAVPAIRIEAPVPGRPLVGIEVPNRKTTLVNLRTVMESDAFRRIPSRLRVALGQDVSGRAVAADLASMPHLLIAGATGSGKSVCINALIGCLLLENTPDELGLLLIDPKRVELTGFNGVPHLVAPVVVEVEQVVRGLRWVCQEMDRRYKLFARYKVRHIDGFNASSGRRKEGRLPYMVVFVDELADLMMVSPDEVERSLCRAAQMGRATGIHLVVATQRPSVDVVTGLIKANFPARIAFAVSTQIDSRVILDAPGAEQLLGRGDMLFMSPDANHLLRLQGCFVADDELQAIADHWRQAVEGDLEAEPGLPWAGLPEDEEDSLFGEAIELVRQHRQASTSFLQRRLRIGYSRAARLIEQLEDQGVIGPDLGGGRSRQVFGQAREVEAGDEIENKDRI